MRALIRLRSSNSCSGPLALTGTETSTRRASNSASGTSWALRMALTLRSNSRLKGWVMGTKTDRSWSNLAERQKASTRPSLSSPSTGRSRQ